MLEEWEAWRNDKVRLSILGVPETPEGSSVRGTRRILGPSSSHNNSSHLQTAPQSSCILQNTHQPVRSMTESSTNSFHRVSHDMPGASASERWASPVGKVPPDCRAKHVTVVMLLSSSCKNTSALMESVRG